MHWYERYYKQLFIIPILLLIASVAVIGLQYSATGDLVHKGVSLEGGVSATVSFVEPVTPDQLEALLIAQYPTADSQVRALDTVEHGFIIEASGIPGEAQEAAETLTNFLEENYPVASITVETTGPALGQAFFLQTILGILLAFLWMGWVVYLYFGEDTKMKWGMGIIAFFLTMMVVNGSLSNVFGIYVLLAVVIASMIAYFVSSVPSGAVILAAGSTIVFTLAVINLLDVHLSTAGIAAFLMLIGYSVDTDILLSTRTIKQRQGTVIERLKNSFFTGITMQLTTTAAVTAAYVLSSSLVIKQIMLIILIGMVGDIIFTWLQNAGIVYWYLHRNKPKAKVVPKTKVKFRRKK